jgi:hypothetical protein
MSSGTTTCNHENCITHVPQTVQSAVDAAKRRIAAKELLVRSFRRLDSLRYIRSTIFVVYERRS